jgi:hypothetical protein
VHSDEAQLSVRSVVDRLSAAEELQYMRELKDDNLVARYTSVNLRRLLGLKCHSRARQELTQPINSRRQL